MDGFIELAKRLKELRIEEVDIEGYLNARGLRVISHEQYEDLVLPHIRNNEKTLRHTLYKCRCPAGLAY